MHFLKNSAFLVSILAVVNYILIIPSNSYAENLIGGSSSPGKYYIYCCTWKCAPGKCQKGYFNGGWACVDVNFTGAKVMCTETNLIDVNQANCVSSINNRNDDTHNCKQDGDECTGCLVINSYRLDGLYPGFSCEYTDKKDPYCLKHNSLGSVETPSY